MSIRVGIGGWTFAPWRGTFFPKGLRHSDELGFAARQLTAIEVNGTFYRTQTPETFRRWAEEVPEDFVFALKAPRFAVNRRVLAEAGPSIEHFIRSGIVELDRKLGPLLWQLPPTKKFDPDDFSRFLDLLPADADGVALRHAVELRHDSFRTPDVIELLRARNIACVYAHSEDYPELADMSADFVYARLQRTREDEPAGYSAEELDAWAERARGWESGGAPADLPYVAEITSDRPREVFAFFISGAKVRAPIAAMGLIERLGGRGLP